MQRREHGRYRIWFPVQVSGNGVDGMAVNHNISAGGMLLAISTELQEGSEVEVKFRMPPDSPTEHAVHGHVVRVESNESDPEGMWPYRLAVVFDEVDAELIPFMEEAAQHLATVD